MFPCWRCVGVVKNFGAVEALVDVDLEVHAHEVVALVGDNGAGSRRSRKVVSGVLQPDAGTDRARGAPGHAAVPAQAYRLGVATVFQDLALCDNLDVTANIFLGREVEGEGS